MKPSQCARSPIAFIIVFLGIAALLFRGLPYITSSTSYISTAIESALRKHISTSNFCTKAVGGGICCELHLKAEPCLNECRKSFMDRETFSPTKEYTECADQCLLVYESNCGTYTPEQKSRTIDTGRDLRMARNSRRSKRRVPKPR